LLELWQNRRMEEETLYAQSRPYVRKRAILAVLAGLGLGGFLLFISSMATSDSWLMGACFGIPGTAVLLLAFIQAWRIWRQPVLLVTAVVTGKKEVPYRGPGGGGHSYYLELRPLEMITITAVGQESSPPPDGGTRKYLTSPLIYSLVTEAQQVQLLCTTIPQRVVALWDE
jgi:hypothetical protein